MNSNCLLISCTTLFPVARERIENTRCKRKNCSNIVMHICNFGSLETFAILWFILSMWLCEFFGLFFLQSAPPCPYCLYVCLPTNCCLYNKNIYCVTVFMLLLVMYDKYCISCWYLWEMKCRLIMQCVYIRYCLEASCDHKD